MKPILTRLLAACSVLTTAGCAISEPYVRPQAAIPAIWPADGSDAAASAGPASTGDWRSVITAPQVQALVQRALADNRDLRVRLAEVAQARAQLREARAAQRPALTVGAQAETTPVGPNVVYGSNYYQAGLSLSDFDLDVFGRLRNLSGAASEQYLASQAGLRDARLTLIAATAEAAVALEADRRLLDVAREESASGERALRITRSLPAAGLAPRSDVDDAATLAAQARSDLADQAAHVAMDRNAIDLLAGSPVADAELSFDLDQLDRGLQRPAAGLSSAVLLKRPDIVEAEHRLKAANFQVGAARAAFFPDLSLTSTVGVASGALGAFLSGGALGVSILPTLAAPLIGGPTRALLQEARADRQGAAAAYHAAVQAAFRDVADDLARLETVDRERAAQAALVAAAANSHRLSETRYKAGAEPFLATLVSQRTLYAARRGAVAVTVADLNARLRLLQHLGLAG